MEVIAQMNGYTKIIKDKELRVSKFIGTYESNLCYMKELSNNKLRK